LLFVESDFMVDELILELLPRVGFVAVVVDEWDVEYLLVESSDGAVDFVDVEQSFVVEIEFRKYLQVGH